MIHGPSCSMACEIFKGLNLCPLHWQVDSYLLYHQGSLASFLLIFLSAFSWNFLSFPLFVCVSWLYCRFLLCGYHVIYVKHIRRNNHFYADSTLTLSTYKVSTILHLLMLQFTFFMLWIFWEIIIAVVVWMLCPFSLYIKWLMYHCNIWSHSFLILFTFHFC